MTNAKDGDHVTLTEGIDVKYLCLDVTQTQREICSTVLIRGSNETFESVEIKLHLCSAERRTNCIVWETRPEGGVDFRHVYILDNKGNMIDFDGMELIEPPNTWTSHSQNVRVTGLITVVDGVGRFIHPIEKIEPA